MSWEGVFNGISFEFDVGFLLKTVELDLYFTASVIERLIAILEH